MEGSTLVSSTGTWADGPTMFAFQWYSCVDDLIVGHLTCTAIDGETSASYAIVHADVGKKLSVEVTASNSAGSDQSAFLTGLVQPDVTAPQTSFLRKPRARTSSHKATFAFESSEAGSTFQCKLDRGSWKACSSPKRLKRLKPGKHTFRVRAKDAVGNVDQTPAKRVWRIKA